MSDEKITQVSLRLTPEVYKMLKDKADTTGLSLNAVVIQAIIEHCDPGHLPNKVTAIEDRLEALERQRNVKEFERLMRLAQKMDIDISAAFPSSPAVDTSA